MRHVKRLVVGVVLCASALACSENGRSLVLVELQRPDTTVTSGRVVVARGMTVASAA